MEKEEERMSCLEDLEGLIFDQGNLFNRYSPESVVAALEYFYRSQKWRNEHPDEEWQESEEYSDAIADLMQDY
jgi:ABC-type nitrate/sulfonate/bicarbonate transport system substrate-binding protein